MTRPSPKTSMMLTDQQLAVTRHPTHPVIGSGTSVAGELGSSSRGPR